MELQAWARNAETDTLRKELLAVKSKNKRKSFVQTWENNVTPETYDLGFDFTALTHLCFSVALYMYILALYSTCC